MTKKIWVVLFVLAFLVAQPAWAANNFAKNQKTAPKTTTSQPAAASSSPAPTVTTPQEEKPMAKSKFVIETTMGNIEGELYNDKAPNTVKNFKDLAKKGFYDGIIFHRV